MMSMDCVIIHLCINIKCHFSPFKSDSRSNDIQPSSQIEIALSVTVFAILANKKL